MNRSIVTTDILDEKLEFEFANNFTGFIGLVESYSKTKRTCKVQPLGKIKTKKGFKNLSVVNLPVSTYYGNGMEIIPDYKKDDLVYCGPNLVPSYNQIRGQYEIDYTRKNKLENLIVVCGVKKQPSEINPQFNKDGLVITDNQTTYVQVANSKIEMKAGTTPAPQKSLLGEDTAQLLKDLIDAILAITVMTPVGPSSPVSAIVSNATQLNSLKNQIDSLLSNGVKHN